MRRLSGARSHAAGHDAVHLFNTTRIHETCLQYREAKRRGVPVVLTPIWHSMQEMARFYSRLYKVPLFPVWKYMAAKELYYARRSRQPVFPDATLRYRALQREVIGGVAMVAPNSQAELETMRQELGVEPRAARVMHPLFDSAPELGHSLRAAGLLCAGPHRTAQKPALPSSKPSKRWGKRATRLLLFGSMSGAHPGYERAVRRELEPGWVEYRGFVSPGGIGRRLPARAKAAILASYFETCGFSALEAIACGAQVCISDTPYTQRVLRRPRRLLRPVLR